MSEHSHDVRKHLKVYLAVFISLAILTAVTVLAALVGREYEFSVAAAVLVGLLIAALKGSLVALFFMHLKSDWKLVYWALAITAIFFAALMLLPLFTGLNSTSVPELHPYGP